MIPIIIFTFTVATTLAGYLLYNSSLDPEVVDAFKNLYEKIQEHIDERDKTIELNKKKRYKRQVSKISEKQKPKLTKAFQIKHSIGNQDIEKDQEDPTPIKFIPRFNKQHIMTYNHKAVRLNSSQTSHKFDDPKDLNMCEHICKHALETYFDKPFNKIRPDWLRNPKTNRKLELDLYNPDVTVYLKGIEYKGLAVEYQGITHYQWPNWVNQTRQGFLDARERDRVKRAICKKRRLLLVEVPYNIPNEKIGLYLFNYLDELGCDNLI